MPFLNWLQIDEQWRKTVIWGSPESFADLLIQIENRLPPHWNRNRFAEGDDKQRGGAFPGSYCFTRTIEIGEVRLWLNRVSPSRLIGGNVLPPKQGEDYWKIVAETITLFRDVLIATAEQAGVRIESDTLGPSSQVPPTVMEALWQFIDEAEPRFPLASRSLPKWRKFVIGARSAQAALDPDEFNTWLASKGWSATDAQRVTEKFYEDAWLLSAYDEAKAPA